MTDHHASSAGQPGAGPSGNVHQMTTTRPRVRWYTCVADRVAEVPHLFERHAWHMIFSPDPMSIKLGLAWYAKPETQAAFRHRRRSLALACMLRRIEAGGWQGRQAERRLHRWPFLVNEEQVTDARRLVEREISVSRNPLATSPREFQGSIVFIMPTVVFTLMFLRACQVGEGVGALATGVSAALFAVMNVMMWGWRQGFREALWLSMQAEKIERSADRETFNAERAADERRRVAATLPCDLNVDVMPAGRGEGYLYVLQFSTGVIKVGQTTRIHRRLGEHRRDAAAFGVNITRCWVSRPHRGFLKTEAALIEACLIAKGRRVRQEYFSGVAFDVAVGFADQLAVRCRPLAEVTR